VKDEAPEIAFDRVTKSFPRTDGAGGTFDAVKDLSFEVRRGELLAILGRTGCGKSTTFNLISGLLRPNAGRISVKGHDPFAQFEWFRGKIGIVFQNDRLMPWRTAFENVELGLELNKMEKQKRTEIVASWLARLGLEAHGGDFPHALSGGMRQRVSIARAFATKPDILLCDEPFSALDEHTGNVLREEFRDLLSQTQATAIFITHSIEEALKLGGRLMVFERPARIAYETRLRADMTEADREEVRANIRRALAADASVLE
jgi:NitT/TauT family transport system ATP-binding protein